MKKKIMLPLIGVMSLLGGLTSCGGGKGSSAPASASKVAETEYGNGQVSLTVWAPAEEFETYSELVNSYNAVQTDPAKTVKLKIVGIGENDVGTKFGSDASKGPDVFQFPGNDLSSFVTKQFLSTLNVTGKSDISINEKTLKNGQVGDVLYALPYTINTYFLYYNKSQIDSKDVGKLSSILNSTTGSQKALGIDIGNGFYQQAVLRGMGLDLYGNNGTSNSSTDVKKEEANAVKAARFIYEVNKNAEKYSTTYGDFITKVQSGELLTAVDGTWNYFAYKEALGEENFGCAVLPTIDITLDGISYNNQLGSPIDNKFIGINSSLSGDKKIAAEEFTYYVVSDAGQRIRYNKRSTIPTADSIINSEDFKKELMADAVTGYNNSTVNFKNPTATKFNSNFWNGATAFSGDLSALKAWDETNAGKAIDAFGKALLA